MTLATRIRTADPLAGRLPDELPARRTRTRGGMCCATAPRSPAATCDPQVSGTRVALGFTPAGRRRWHAVTRRVAERGRARASDQHVAFVLDHRLLVAPLIDYQRNPDGLDGRTGADIAGSFTPARARVLVALLRTGALPLRLTP